MPESFDQRGKDYDEDIREDEDIELFEDEDIDEDDFADEEFDDEAEDESFVSGEAQAVAPLEADDPIADLLFDLVNHMGFKDVEIEWEERPDHVRYFIEGEDMGALIGRHGSTLEALQYLVGAINGRKSLINNKIVVDIEGYRERREKRLLHLAKRSASMAIREGQEIVLEPMTAGDRRMIHITLSSNPAVTTFSEGEEPFRCVVVKPRRERR